MAFSAAVIDWSSQPEPLDLPRRRLGDVGDDLHPPRVSLKGAMFAFTNAWISRAVSWEEATPERRTTNAFGS